MKKTLLAAALAAAMPCVAMAMASDIGTVTVDGTEQSVNMGNSQVSIGESANTVAINGVSKRYFSE